MKAKALATYESPVKPLVRLGEGPGRSEASLGSLVISFVLLCSSSRVSALARVISQSGSFEPRCEKTALRGFRPGPTQTGL